MKTIILTLGIIVAISSLGQTSLATSDKLSIMPDNSGFPDTAGSLQVRLVGEQGGVTQELVGYFEKAGITGVTTSGDGTTTSYKDAGMTAWHTTAPGPFFTFFFDVKNNTGTSLGWNSFRLNAVTNAATTPAKIYYELTLPDYASAELYSLMLKSGVSPSPDDISKSLKGQNLICSGYHGYPRGPLSPSCYLNIQ